MYLVEGGIFTGTDWKEVVPGTEERYGPYKTYEQAKEAWIRHSFNQRLDICTHRMFIKEI